MVSVCSRSMGLVMLLVECRRRGLYQSLIQVAMSRLAWGRVAQRRRAMSSWVRVEKNDSAAALSRAGASHGLGDPEAPAGLGEV